MSNKRTNTKHIRYIKISEQETENDKKLPIIKF